MQQEQIYEFTNKLMAFYETHGRHDMAWRQPQQDGSLDPYKIWLSEVMLQQTQVARVVDKFHLFLAHYPRIKDLAAASFEVILRDWSGLGYNRRAKYMHQSAQLVSSKYDGKFPKSIAELVALPGIGYGTAAAICVYAYNQPAIFIETNVRTVFIYEFFNNKGMVYDKQILPLLEQALIGQDPRTFYWALMDYGSHLKRTIGNSSRRSSSYKKQTAFVGSRRQLRGQVVALLLERSALSEEVVKAQLNDERTKDVIDALIREGVLRRRGSKLRIA